MSSTFFPPLPTPKNPCDTHTHTSPAKKTAAPSCSSPLFSPPLPTTGSRHPPSSLLLLHIKGNVSLLFYSNGLPPSSFGELPRDGEIPLLFSYWASFPSPFPNPISQPTFIFANFSPSSSNKVLAAFFLGWLGRGEAVVAA